MKLLADVGMTLNYILDASADKFADRPAIGMAMETPMSYATMRHRVLLVAERLLHDGVEKGDRVAILAENSEKWGIAYLAIVRIGAVAVPILPEMPEGDVHHILSEMRVKVLFTSSRQLEKIEEARQPFAEKLVTLDDYQGRAEAMPIVTYADYLREARELHAEDAPLVFPEVGEDDLAAILYTSGSSGYSKAVMLTHKNLTANAYAASGLMKISPDWTFLSILTMAHAYEFTCGFVLPLLNGCRIVYAGKAPTPAILQRICRHEKPQVIFAVPLVMEKIYKKRVRPSIEQSGVLSFCCRYRLGRALIYRRICARLLEFFGGRLQLMGIGGAALNPEVEQFLAEARFPYLIGYGLTEGAPLLAGGPFGDQSITVGSTGKPMPGVEIRIANANANGIGEIQAAGPNIMAGYHGNPEATAQVLSPGGWLSTGDLGRFDDAGNLCVRGRLKNVIVLSNGENVYIEPIEHKINAFPWVAESLVLESAGKLEAWVYPDYEQIDEQTAGQSPGERHQRMAQLMEELRQRINEQVAPSSRLSRILERREPFVKTATHKIKRYLYDPNAANL
ncbi:MAG: AMP-binding protein [Desulfobulbaceae bacterium]|jgi:long-chain acyl-CoA synthetase|nr:AMP-binding protein [Desulfobulbaceae bacterium]